MLVSNRQDQGETAMQEVFTVSEVAAMLKVTPVALRQRLRNGTLGGFRIGTDWRIPKADLDAFIERNRNSDRPERVRSDGDADPQDRAALALAETGDFEDWQTVKARNGL